MLLQARLGAILELMYHGEAVDSMIDLTTITRSCSYLKLVSKARSRRHPRDEMWLLDAKAYKLRFESTATVSRYAILSHTWSDDEVLCKYLSTDDWNEKKGALRLRYSCEQALIDHYDFVWVDICCTDKTSSAELPEAINSTFD